MKAPSPRHATLFRSRRGKRSIADVEPDRRLGSESPAAPPGVDAFELLAQVALSRAHTVQVLEAKTLSAGGLIVATSDRSQTKSFNLDKRVTVALQVVRKSAPVAVPVVRPPRIHPPPPGNAGFPEQSTLSAPKIAVQTSPPTRRHR